MTTQPLSKRTAQHSTGARIPLTIGDPRRRDGAFMGPSGRNRWQMRQSRKRLKQANPQPSATHSSGSRPHGKEGVDYSTLQRPAQLSLSCARGLGNRCLPCQPRWRARWARSTTVASFFRVLSAEPVRTGKRHGCASCPNGLEPLTPSLPCAAKRLPCVATGCGSACLSGFRARPICHRLPPVAPAGLHKCSIHPPGIADGQRGFGRPAICASSVEPFSVERVTWSEPTARRDDELLGLP